MKPNADVISSLGHHAAKYTPCEADAPATLGTAFEASPLSLAQRLQAFPRHSRRQDIARFLAKYELFKLCVGVHGSVAECGVFTDTGLLAWMHFSTILEPYNHTRRIIGFDTFAGFPAVSGKDLDQGNSEHLHAGAFGTHPGIREEIEAFVAIHDQNRPLGHIPKVELVAGNACETIPHYVETHPHVIISLLYLDFDIYEPTKAALQNLYPRVVKGGIVAFDELNCAEFPGETVAMLESLGPDLPELRRFSFDPYISYLVRS
ncbi:MAG: class I SAM-dependent methyltransferase [Planctomycetota bacterium]|nr:class I SAM-dependent methyltransferase [Planctomycetota bacterium]